MTAITDPRVPAYDPFGEPLAFARACPEAKSDGVAGSYRETRRALMVFWALALLFVGGRIYLSDLPVVHRFAEAATSVVTMAFPR